MSDRQKRRGFFIFLLASTALSTTAMALDPSGSAVKVTRITDADGPGGARPLVTEGPVFMGDEITTNPNGLAQILFLDDTKIVVGPNSRLVVDSFVFNADNTAREVTVDTVQGFFRFISGNSPNEAYTIRTPTMTIGLRGTALDIHANGPGSRTVILDGGVEGCDAAGVCMDFTGDCTLYYAPRGGGFETPSGLDRRLQMSAYFPFVGSQNDLDPRFRLDVSECVVADSRLIDRTPEPEGNHSPQRPPYQD